MCKVRGIIGESGTIAKDARLFFLFDLASRAWHDPYMSNKSNGPAAKKSAKALWGSRVTDNETGDSHIVLVKACNAMQARAEIEALLTGQGVDGVVHHVAPVAKGGVIPG